jgi:hypothetical protein
MTWFRLDDAFHNHPKAIRAGNAGVGLWVRCGTWSANHLTDGVIPAEVVNMYGKGPDIARVTAARLWVQEGDEYVIPDYLEYNPSRETVLAQRAADAERKRAARARGARNGRRGRADGRFGDEDDHA